MSPHHETYVCFTESQHVFGELCWFSDTVLDLQHGCSHVSFIGNILSCW
jgi:hypothetical protein